MKKVKFIYWFAYYNDDSPSVRYRGKYPLNYFNENYAIKSAFIVPSYHPKKILKFVRYYLSALLFRKKESVIVIQRVHSNFIYSNLLKLLVSVQKKYTVYDLDDADYLYVPPQPIYDFAKKCSHVTAGSRAIKKHLSNYTDQIIQTTSPIVDLQLSKTKKNACFTIGWIGGFGGDHKKSLVQFVFPAIKALDLPCCFKLLGVTSTEDKAFITTYFNDCKNIKLEIPLIIDWKNELSLQKEICTFDVGIATLLNTEIQRSKSGIKAKQYLNNGVPVLATNLPENDWVIQEGITGYFCDNITDFKKRLFEFYHMKNSDYMEFSKAARASIKAYDLKKYYSDFIKICNF